MFKPIQKIFKNVRLPMHDKDIMKQTKYGEAVSSTIIKNSTAPNTINYILKQNLLEATIINENLVRVISLLNWKLINEVSSNRIKEDSIKMLEKSVEDLHEILEKTRKSHHHIRKKINKLEFTLGFPIHMNNYYNCRSGIAHSLNNKSKARIRRTIRKKFNLDKKNDQFKSDGNFSALIAKKDFKKKTHMKSQSFGKSIESLSCMSNNLVDDTFGSNKGFEENDNLVIEEYDDENSDSQLNNEEIHNRKKSRMFKTEDHIKIETNCDDVQFLQNKILCLQNEVSLQTARSEQLKAAYLESTNRVKNLKRQAEDIEERSNKTLINEAKNWEKILGSVKVLITLGNFRERTSKKTE